MRGSVFRIVGPSSRRASKHRIGKALPWQCRASVTQLLQVGLGHPFRPLQRFGYEPERIKEVGHLIGIGGCIVPSITSSQKDSARAKKIRINAPHILAVEHRWVEKYWRDDSKNWGSGICLIVYGRRNRLDGFSDIKEFIIDLESGMERSLALLPRQHLDGAFLGIKLSFEASPRGDRCSQCDKSAQNGAAELKPVAPLQRSVVHAGGCYQHRADHAQGNARRRRQPCVPMTVLHAKALPSATVAAAARGYQ